jgi:hypothetical protein
MPVDLGWPLKFGNFELCARTCTIVRRMSDELRSFHYIRTLGVATILWLGGLVVDKFEASHLFFLAVHWISRSDDQSIYLLRYTLLASGFYICSYAVLVIVAAFWYFRNAKRSAGQGILLGIVSGIGWRAAHILENSARSLLGLPTVVRHFDPVAWLLLIAACAVVGAFMRPVISGD